RSVDPFTVVVADAVLLAVFGSVCWPATVALLVIVPPLFGAVTTIVAVALAPLARLPIVQVTVPELLTQPVLADTNVTPVGSGSVTATPVAGLGPAVLTDRVQENF